MIKGWKVIAVACGCFLLATAAASAQSQGRGQASPAPPQKDGGRGPLTVAEMNRQILPTNLDFEQILPTMQGYRDALGVTCGYCHVYVSPYNPRNDFASDIKEPKKKARVMMRMVQSINRTVEAEIPPLDHVEPGQKPGSRNTLQVQCVTCHRGVPIPKQLVDIVLDTGNSQGAAAAVAQYRDLRRKFDEAQAYDFSDVTLFVAAQRSNAASKPDNAIAYAQLNVEFHPKSARSYQVMSQAYALKKETTSAIAAIEKALAIDPTNMAFQTQLNDLKNPGQAGQRRE